MGFSVPSIIFFSGGVVNVNTTQHAHPALQPETGLTITLDYLRKAREIVMEIGIFVEGRSQTLLYYCKRGRQSKKDQKNLRTKLFDC